LTRVAVTAAALLLASGVASAQTRPRLDVTLPAAEKLAAEGPTVRVQGVMADSAMLVLVRSGFPMRLHYRVELWAARRLFDDVLASVEWDVVVRYDALNEQYRVFRVDGERVRQLGAFTSADEAAYQVERAIPAPLRARPGNTRQYYRAVVDVETLSDNELDEVERWLRGELRPAVRGERNPGTALGRGVRRVFVRVLGGEQRHLETRSPSFRVIG
jgi:hypothetical protein